MSTDRQAINTQLQHIRSASSTFDLIGAVQHPYFFQKYCGKKHQVELQNVCFHVRVISNCWAFHTLIYVFLHVKFIS